jgi:hypothetical protein
MTSNTAAAIAAQRTNRDIDALTHALVVDGRDYAVAMGTFQEQN